MGRTGALALALLGLLGLGVGARVRSPPSAPALACEPSAVHKVEGVAVCGPGAPLSASWRAGLGLRVNLNTVSAEELARVKGVGASLARRLVREREARGAFSTWDEVALVPGVGEARLAALQATTTLQ